MKKLSAKNIKIFKTCNLYLCFFTLGLCIALPGPCLLDLSHLVNTDAQNIAFIYTARSIGYLIGSVFGGILLDFVKSKQAALTVFSFIISATMLGISWSRNLGTLTGYMVINGLSLGALDTGGNVVCLTLWGSDSGPFYQALHFTFGLGGLVSPLIAAPFLGDYSDFSSLDMDTESNLSNRTSEHLYNITRSNSTNETIPQITYPFSIIGIFGFFVALLFLIVSIIAPTEGPRTHKEESRRKAKRGFKFMLSVIFLNFLLVFVETGTEIGYAQMLTTYVAKGPPQLTTSVGSYMTSAFWAAFTTARLVSIFLAIKVSSLTLIVSDLVITLLGAAVLLFLKAYSWSLWLASVLLGSGIASFYPAAVGWLDSYINVTNKIASIFAVGAAFGEMVIPFAISYFMKFVPEVLIYIVPASCILSSAIVPILYIIFQNSEKKLSKVEPTKLFSISSTVNP